MKTNDGQDVVTIGKLANGLLRATRSEDAERRAGAIQDAYALLTKTELSYPDSDVRQWASDMKRELQREGARRSGKLQQATADADAAFTRWREAAKAADAAEKRMGIEVTGASVQRDPILPSESDRAAIAARGTAYGEYREALKKQAYLNEGLQGLYARDDVSKMRNVLRGMFGMEYAYIGPKLEAVPSDRVTDERRQFAVPERIFDLPAIRDDPAARMRMATLAGPVIRDNNGARIDTPFGQVDITKDLEQFNKPEVRESIRKAMLGVDPENFGMQQGNVVDSVARRIASWRAKHSGVEDLEKYMRGFQWDVRAADPGVVLPYLPNLYGEEGGGGFKSYQAIQSPSKFRALMEVVRDMQQKGELRRTAGEVAIGQAVGLSEFMVITMTGEALIGGAAKAFTTAKAAKMGSLAERLPVLPWLTKTGDSMARLYGYGGRWQRGFQFGARDIAEEVMYGIVQGAADQNSTVAQGALQGAGEGIAEAALGGIARIGRRAMWKGMSPLLSDKLRRLGDTDMGGRTVDDWMNRLRGLPSKRVDLKELLGKDFRNARRMQQVLMGLDAAFVGASFGGYEGALAEAGQDEWERMSLSEKALLVAKNMAGPEALGNVAVFTGTGAAYGGIAELGIGPQAKAMNADEKRIIDGVTREMVAEMLSPDNWAQWKEYVEMFDAVRKANPDLAREFRTLSPLERVARADDDFKEFTHWLNLRENGKVFSWKRQMNLSGEELEAMHERWMPAVVTKYEESVGGKIKDVKYRGARPGEGGVRIFVNKKAPLAIKIITEVSGEATFGIVSAKNPTTPIKNTQLWTTLEGAMNQAQHIIDGKGRGGGGKKTAPKGPPDAPGQGALDFEAEGSGPTGPVEGYSPTPPQGEFDFEAEWVGRAEDLVGRARAGELIDPQELADAAKAGEGFDGPAAEAIRATLEEEAGPAALPREETLEPTERDAATRKQAIDPQTAHKPLEGGPQEAVAQERRERVKRAQPAQEPPAPTVEVTPEAEAQVKRDDSLSLDMVLESLNAGAGTVNVAGLLLDPDTFQHKSGTEEGTGVDPSNPLGTAERYNKAFERPIIVFEYSDGRMVVADGHQRTAFAKRIGKESIPAFILRESDGLTEQHAAVAAGLTNMAYGTAKATDIAKVFRSVKLTDEDVRRFGSDPSRANARNAQGIAKLNDEVFRMVETGKLPEKYGAEIGRALEQQPQLQIQAANAALKGKLRNADQVRYLAEAIAHDAVISASQKTLFGDIEEQSSLYIAKAEVADYLAKKAKREKGAFGSLARNADFAEKIQGHINVSAAKAEHGELGSVIEAINTLGMSKGTSINGIITRAAQAIADGGDRKSILSNAWQELREADFLADADFARQQDPVSPVDAGHDAGDPGGRIATPAELRTKSTGQQLIQGGEEEVVLEGTRTEIEGENAEAQIGLYDEEGGLFEDQAAARDKGYRAFPKLMEDLNAGRRVVFISKESPKDLREDLEKNGVLYVDLHSKKPKAADKASVILAPSREVVEMLSLEGSYAIHDPHGNRVERAFAPKKEGPAEGAPSGVQYIEGASFVEDGDYLVLSGVTLPWVKANITSRAVEGSGGTVVVSGEYRARVEGMVAPPVADPEARLKRALKLEAAHAPPPSSLEPRSGDRYAIDRLAAEPEMPTATRLAQAGSSARILLNILDGIGMDVGDFRKSPVAFSTLMMLATEHPKMLEAFQKSASFKSVNAASDAYNEAVGQARNYLAFMQLSALEAARRSGDKSVLGAITSYFRAREDYARTGEFEKQTKAELEQFNMLDEGGIYFKQGTEEALHEWFGEVMRQSRGDGTTPMFAGGPSHLFGGPDMQDEFGVRAFPASWGKMKAVYDSIAPKMPKWMRWANVEVTDRVGRFWSAAGLPSALQGLNYRAMNEVFRDSNGRKAQFSLDTIKLVQQLAFLSAPLPRQVARRIPAAVRSGILRTATSPEDFGRALGGEQWAYLYPILKRYVEHADAVGVDLRDLGFITSEQFEAHRQRYMMRESVRADKRTIAEIMQDTEFKGLSFAARDLNTSDAGRQDMALAIMHPEYLMTKGMLQEAHIRMVFEVLQDLVAKGIAMPYSQLQARREDGGLVWDEYTRSFFEVGAVPVQQKHRQYNPATGEMDVQVDPVSKRTVKGRQGLLHYFLNNMRSQMADEGVDAEPGQHPWTREKAKMLDDWLGIDVKAEARKLMREARVAKINEDAALAKSLVERAREMRETKPDPGVVITHQVGMEIETILRDMSDTTPSTARAFFGKDSASAEGVLAQHWAKRVDEMSRWWRRAKTVQNPVHWTLSRVSDVMTNWTVADVPLLDFATSVLFGKGAYADSWRHLLWWQRWNELGAPREADRAQIPEQLKADGWTAEQWAAVRDVQEATEFLMGGTFVTALIQSGAITDLIGGGLNADNLTQRMQQDLAERRAMGEGSELSAMLGDAMSEYGRRMATGQASQDRKFLELWNTNDAQARVDAISGWTAQYQMWELAAKYTASLSLRRRNYGMGFRESLIYGARGTADYADTSPWLRRWSTQFNFASGKGWDSIERSPGLRRFARAMTASPFWMYQSAMIPSRLRSAVRRPHKVAVSWAIMAAVQQGIRALWRDRPEEEESFLRAMAISRDSGGTPLLSHEEALVLTEKVGLNRFWMAAGGELSSKTAENLASFFVGMLTLSPHKFRSPKTRYGELRTTDVGELMGPTGTLLEAATSLRDAPRRSVRDRGQAALETLNGYVPTLLLGSISGIGETIYPRKGETRFEAGARQVQKFASAFAPVFHPETYLLSNKGQLWAQLSLLEGQGITDFIKGRHQALVVPAEERLRAGLFGTLWKSRRVIERGGVREEPELGRAILNQLAGAVGVENTDDSVRAYSGATRKVADQFFQILGATYDKWTDYDFQAPNTLDMMLSGPLNLAGDVDLEALKSGQYRLKEGQLKSSMALFIARQPAGEQPRLIETAIAFLGGPAWEGYGRGLALEAGRQRKFEAPMWVALYRSAVYDKAGIGMLEYLHRGIVREKRDTFTRTLADTYPFFLEITRPKGGPEAKKWAELFQVYKPWERVPGTGEGKLPPAKLFGSFGPEVGQEGAGLLTGPGARQELSRPK